MQVLLIFVLAILSLNTRAFTQKHLQKLSEIKKPTYQDLAHENPGCPENSECSAANGIKIQKLVTILKQYQTNAKILSKKLEEFRKENGVPVEFLFKDEAQIKQSIDPIIWDSHCRHHNSPAKKEKILKGMQFFRNNPKSKSIHFIKVRRNEKLIYEIPYGDQPLMIWQEQLITVKDYEDIFYSMAITSQGKWKVIEIPTSRIAKAQERRENTACKSSLPPDDYYVQSYCFKIWNADTDRLEIIEQQWSCP